MVSDADKLLIAELTVLLFSIGSRPQCGRRLFAGLHGVNDNPILVRSFLVKYGQTFKTSGIRALISLLRHELSRGTGEADRDQDKSQP